MCREQRMDETLIASVLASAVRVSKLPPTAAEQQGPQPARERVRFYRGGRLVAQLEAAPGAAAAARLLDAEGRHTHTVLHSVSPLVRHLTFVSELAPARHKSGAVVARCRRAWLPPSSVWLFPPLSYDHDAGGWYIEWAGHEDHPAWLDPGIVALAAAFHTLDSERASRQPQGLFARLRHGDETAGVGAWESMCAWVKAMLRFHR
jgi:hypothetical protein